MSEMNPIHSFTPPFLWHFHCHGGRRCPLQMLYSRQGSRRYLDSKDLFPRLVYLTNICHLWMLAMSRERHSFKSVYVLQVKGIDSVVHLSSGYLSFVWKAEKWSVWTVNIVLQGKFWLVKCRNRGIAMTATQQTFGKFTRVGIFTSKTALEKAWQISTWSLETPEIICQSSERSQLFGYIFDQEDR
jgi:hypothetical protein